MKCIEEEELECYDLSALYRLFKYMCNYIYTFSMYKGKKGETEIGYRGTSNSTTVTLVLYVPGVKILYT